MSSTELTIYLAVGLLLAKISQQSNSITAFLLVTFFWPAWAGKWLALFISKKK